MIASVSHLLSLFCSFSCLPLLANGMLDGSLACPRLLATLSLYPLAPLHSTFCGHILLIYPGRGHMDSSMRLSVTFTLEGPFCFSSLAIHKDIIVSGTTASAGCLSKHPLGRQPGKRLWAAPGECGRAHGVQRPLSQAANRAAGRAENRLPTEKIIRLPLIWKRRFPDCKNNRSKDTTSEGAWPT